MAEERLYPSLLERLTDDAPDKLQDSQGYRVWSSGRLREDVEQHLEKYLLKTENFESVQNLDKYPFVKSSVINYGIPVLKGKTLSGLNLNELERQIKSAIVNFEPRIYKNSLTVKITSKDTMNKNAITIEITSDVWAQPVPLAFYLKVELDLETGFIQRKN